MQSLTDTRAWLSPRNARFWVVILLILYTLAGFFLVPWLLQRELPGFAQTLVQRDAAVTTVRFNPLTLALEAEDFELRDTDGSDLIGFGKLRLNFQVSSLFRWALVFREVRLTAPTVNLVRDGFADTNLGRLAAAASGPADPAAEPPEDAGILRLVIHELQIADGVMDVTDRMPATAFQTRLEPINIQVNNLSTLPNDQGDQVIRISTEGDGLIEWDGTLQVNPLDSAGRITLKLPGLPLLTRYLDDVLDFDLDGGLLDMAFDYQVQAQPDGAFLGAVNGLDLSVTETELATEDSAEPFFGFQNLRIAGGELRWPEAEASVEDIVLTGPTLETWLDPDGNLNLAQLVEERADALEDSLPAADAEADPTIGGDDTTTVDADETTAEVAGTDATAVAGATVAAATEDEPATDFKLSIGRVFIDGLQAHFEDRTLPETGRVELSSLNLEVRELNNTPDARFPFDLDLEVASGGTVNAAGQLGVLPAVVAQADVNLDQLALPVAQPWLVPFVRAGLDAGTLSGKTTVESLPEEMLDLRGQLTIDGLQVSDAGGEDLVRWRQLAVQDLIFQLTANQLEIARLTLREPFARVEIDGERQLNFAKAIVEPPPGAPAEPVEPGEPLVFRMGRSFIENGSVDFADLSLPLPFRTDVRGFGGNISALASDTREPSELDFEGRVGEFGQAKVTGQLTALDPLAQSAVRVEFRNVNMPDLSPYTVDFAGRKIAAGKLNLDLDYRFEKAQLVGKNEIVVEKIQLGDKVDNPDALDLPLGLAVALLSDTNGVIDIKLTIEGDVNDPEFSARGVVAKALANLLVKAVTSPFRLLGSLVGGGEDVDLQNIAFEPGEAILSPPEEEKLTQLGTALAQRPGLQLSVPGAYAAQVDTEGIAAARVDAAARAEAEAGDSDELLAERAEKALEKMAREQLPDLSLRELRKQFEVQDDDPDTPDFDTLAYLSEIQRRLVAAEPVSEAELQALGDTRAAAIADYLVENAGLPPERIVVTDTAQVEPGEENQVTISLQLDAG
ncbi:MAG: DUF748 domain-containing protein [Chromatiales bacterium]|nr:MAG: DUF748 domain-containing protein [Chromatiales bacterium]